MKTNQANEEALASISRSVRHAQLSVLRYATDPVNPWEPVVENVDSAKAQITETQTMFVAGSAVITALGNAMAVLEEVALFYEDAESEAAFGQMDTINKELLPRLDQVDAVLTDQRETLGAALERVTAETQQATETANRQAIVAYGLVIAVAVLLSTLFGRALSRPIRRARDRILSMAEHDYHSPISDQRRGDEVGGIAQGLESLRGKLQEAERNEKRAKEENGRRVELFQTLGVAMSQLRGGRLQSRIAAGDWNDLGDSYVQLCSDFNDLAVALQVLVDSLRASTGTVQTNAHELSSMSDEMSRRAEMQAATLEESAAALDVLAAGVKSAADRAEDADRKVVEGRRRAEQGGEVMGRALQAMSSIAKSSEQISQIITVIDDIAFQTNLLALNAGVEAARAGESGKGFSVVASEVRGLAQRASESANEIKELVLNSADQVEDGERLVQATSETLTHIVESVTEVSEMVAGIATLSREQAGNVEEINVGIGELDKVTQQNAAMVSQTSTASQQLTVEATRLSDLLTRFTGGGSVAPATASVGGQGIPELFDAPAGGGADAPAVKAVATGEGGEVPAGKKPEPAKAPARAATAEKSTEPASQAAKTSEKQPAARAAHTRPPEGAKSAPPKATPAKRAGTKDGSWEEDTKATAVKTPAPAPTKQAANAVDHRDSTLSGSDDTWSDF
ncbi:methyl-accepting chemotaxis protein [Sagittula sp. M10.9X]|uniref:Methyl-accepting chemotaxis protein n=2 Tax=Sagittula salina TaxID=2820268 RepID=A0A940S132_9RHOB|nr:methyl-accepting chemotaxis protein [Sagittula salina]